VIYRSYSKLREPVKNRDSFQCTRFIKGKALKEGFSFISIQIYFRMSGLIKSFNVIAGNHLWP
jgi:hypothetical protein